MTDEQEMTIGKTSKVTLGLVIVICGLLVMGAGTSVTAVVFYTNTRHSDREENRNGRDQILKAIQEVKDGQQQYRNATDARLGSVEARADKASADRWSSKMMEIYVLRCREAGDWVDPAPIIDRYNTR